MENFDGTRDEAGLEERMPVLYSFRRCPYAMRARLAIHSSGIAVELREILLRDKAREFLAASPKGTVPVLITAEGQVIEESLDVMLWALGRNDPETLLQPDIGNLDEMLELVSVCDNQFKAQLDAYKYASRDTPEKGFAAREAGMAFLLTLDDRLGRTRHLFGARIALGDLAVFPFVRQFANVDRDWFDAQSWPSLRGWLDEQLSAARFACIMKKYPKWQAGDAPTTFHSAN